MPKRSRSEVEKKFLIDAIDAFKRKLLIISPEYKILAANNTAMAGHPESIIGKPCYEVIPGCSSPCPSCPANKVMKEGKASLRYDLSHNFSGNEDTLCLYSYPVYLGDQMDAFVMLDFDLPALKNMEERRIRSNSFLRNLIHSAVDGVIAADPTGKILIFNEAAVQFSGYTVKEALNDITIRDVYSGEGAREVMQMLLSEDYGGEGKLISYHIDAKHKSGEIFPISLSASIVHENGKIVATIGFFHDRREEIRMKKELEKTQVQLLQAEKMASLGKMAAGVAHQLNNPLGGIILFTKLVMEEYDLPADAMADLERVLNDANRTKDIVKELLEFSRQTSRDMKPQDINDIISRTIFLLENQSIFHNIEIEKNLDTDLPRIMGDAQQLNHVFMNMILNAADALEGSGKLGLKTHVLAEAEMVCIEISDTGSGIAEDVLPHIFEPFYTTKEQGKGTGLGLSMVYGIVESHGGRIYAESELGKGTTFYIEFPIGEIPEGGNKIG
ncbi:MAG: PAS domain S-box protein [Desulfobacteraceae bacterium]|nr:PAS domain S-box protein [Desulfobacteraceae bacterium]MBC2755282.1 PAS domain S-box protein [Desulfobacteraceae bacterium]